MEKNIEDKKRIYKNNIEKFYSINRNIHEFDNLAKKSECIAQYINAMINMVNDMINDPIIISTFDPIEKEIKLYKFGDNREFNKVTIEEIFNVDSLLDQLDEEYKQRIIAINAEMSELEEYIIQYNLFKVEKEKLEKEFKNKCHHIKCIQTDTTSDEFEGRSYATFTCMKCGKVEEFKIVSGHLQKPILPNDNSMFESSVKCFESGKEGNK